MNYIQKIEKLIEEAMKQSTKEKGAKNTKETNIKNIALGTTVGALAGFGTLVPRLHIEPFEHSSSNVMEESISAAEKGNLITKTTIGALGALALAGNAITKSHLATFAHSSPAVVEESLSTREKIGTGVGVVGTLASSAFLLNKLSDDTSNEPGNITIEDLAKEYAETHPNTISPENRAIQKRIDLVTN